MEKQCTKCGETKPLDEYHRRKNTRDGRQSHCKACVKAQNAEYYARPEVKARMAEWRADYYAANRDAIKAYRAEYYAKNRDAILAQKVEYNARPEVKAHRSEWQAEYQDRNPHLWWESYYRERARSYGFTPRVSSFTREELYERWGTRCFHCGSEDVTTLDHYPTPISRGGEHSLENARPSCAKCQQYSWREDFTPTANTQEVSA